MRVVVVADAIRVARVVDVIRAVLRTLVVVANRVAP